MSDYEKFRLQWMLDHGHSLRELMEELQSLQYDDPEDSDRISTVAHLCAGSIRSLPTSYSGNFLCVGPRPAVSCGQSRQ